MEGKKLIPVYTSDLYFTPDADILSAKDPQEINYIHGIAPLTRWCETVSFKRTMVMVPATISAYNMCMGSVEILDQKTNALLLNTKRRMYQ